MLISQVMAQTAAVAAEAPSPWEVFALNMLLIMVLVVIFYVLLIMPQQKRFKKHREMLDQLKGRQGRDVERFPRDHRQDQERGKRSRYRPWQRRQGNGPALRDPGQGE
jgi:type II secretory pathway component PulM